MIQVKFAEKSAWRAVYVYIGKMHGPGPYSGFREHKIFHLGIDPNTIGPGPTLFGGFFPLPRRRGFDFRVKLPHISWTMVMRSNYNERLLKLYKLQQTFLHNLDGRYGWGSGYK